MKAKILRVICILAIGRILLVPALAQDSSLKSLVAIGRQLESEGRFAKAEELLRSALKQAHEKNAGPLVTAAILDCLATTLADEAHYIDAERLLGEALSITQRAAGPNSNASATLIWHLAWVYGECGQMEAAEPLLSKYEAIVVANASNNPNAAEDLGNLGRIYALRHSPRKALALFQRAVDILEAQSNPDTTRLARALLDRAGAFGAVRNFGAAFADIQRVRALVGGSSETAPALGIDLAVTEGTVSREARQFTDSAAAYVKAIQIAETFYGGAHPLLAFILADYARTLRSMGKKKEASAFAERAKHISNTNADGRMLGYSITALKP
jgi:tetratricopeptide (TPR) repeat protein